MIESYLCAAGPPPTRQLGGWIAIALAYHYNRCRAGAAVVMTALPLSTME